MRNLARPRDARLHNRGVARSAGQSQRLEVGPDVAAVLRPEEAMRLHDIRDIERLRCRVCGEWIEPASSTRTSVSVSLDDGDGVTVGVGKAPLLTT